MKKSESLICPFGKYRGKTFYQIMTQDSKYSKWLLSTFTENPKYDSQFSQALKFHASIFQRNQQIIKNEKIEKEKDFFRNSEHIATPGKYARRKVTVLGIREVETSYGVMFVVKMVDEYGSCIVWNTSQTPFEKVFISDDSTRYVLAVEFVVKEHDSYNEIPRTVVKNLKRI